MPGENTLPVLRSCHLGCWVRGAESGISLPGVGIWVQEGDQEPVSREGWGHRLSDAPCREELAPRGPH